jgi:hypothetical protein
VTYGEVVAVEDLQLRDHVTLRDNGEWVTGKVVELALHGDKYETIIVTLLTDVPNLRRIHRVPGTLGTRAD